MECCFRDEASVLEARKLWPGPVWSDGCWLGLQAASTFQLARAILEPRLSEGSSPWKSISQWEMLAAW